MRGANLLMPLAFPLSVTHTHTHTASHKAAPRDHLSDRLPAGGCASESALGDPDEDKRLLSIRHFHLFLLYILMALQLLAGRVQFCPVVLVIRTGWEEAEWPG